MLGLGFGLNRGRRVGGGYVGLLDLYPNAAAAYSLRKLRAAYSGSAVRVRRSSDNTEQDIGFVDNELDTASLLSFVNEDVDVYTSDFSSTEDLSEFNGTGAAAQSVGGVDDAYKFTLSNGNIVHFAMLNLPEYNQTYSVTLDYYIPSGQTVTDIEASRNTTSQHTLDSVGAWTTETFTFITGDDSNPNNRRIRFVTNAYIDLNADGDVFYLKNIVITQTTADGLVSTWYDQSLSNDATQSTAADQPKIVSGGSLVTENGKVAIEFDGVDDVLISNYALNESASSFSGFATFKYLDNRLNGVLLQGGRSHLNIGSNKLQTNIGGVGLGLNTVADSLHALSVYTWNLSTGLLTYTNNGATPTSVTTTADRTATQTGIGATQLNAVNAYVNAQEIIIYPSDQSANRTAIETNINTFYSIYP